MIRTILHYPDPRLREETKVIESVTPELERLIEDMAETMYAAPGVGLAAPQIGEPVRLFIVDIASEDEPSQLMVFLNPEILSQDGECVGPEGCLSFPGVTEDIKRAESVKVRAMGRDGEPFELEATGFLAIAIQHELDHLNGVLMIDRLGVLKKRIVHRKMQKRSVDARA